jgi:GNAT superfamily N-acetyltransferase
MPLRLTFSLAIPEDAAGVAAVRGAAAEHLSTRFGRGHWSAIPTAHGVLVSMRHAKLLIARMPRRDIVGVLRLATKKPWTIDVACFTPCGKALYLTDMAVAPPLQGRGIGRALLEEAWTVARGWPAEMVRLDAYDAPAGAGGFYARCGLEERGRAVYRSTPLIYYERQLG